MIAEQVVALRLSRPAGILIGVLAIVLLDALVWGVMTTQMLTNAQSELASTTQRLSGGAGDLAARQAEIARLTSEKDQLVAANAQLTAENQGLTTKLAGLTAQATQQTLCITALRANVTALQGIATMGQTNLDRVGKGSAWARANDAVVRAFETGARQEIVERETEPHTWIVQGRAAITTMKMQTGVVAEATATIHAALAAATAAQTLSAPQCGS